MNLFSYVKGKVAIVDVVNEYTNLKNAGLYLKAHCPFHNEKTASFTVSPHKEIFYCFGCHAGGDVIAFIAKIENCSPLEAVRHLATRYAINVPAELTMRDSREASVGKSEFHYTICGHAARWAHDQLMHTPQALDYLEKRGITQSSIAAFSLGYFPSKARTCAAFIEAMNRHHIVAQDLVEAAILVEGNRGLYCPFEDRIIFPISDHLGRCCSFGGRIFKSDDERPKYYNCHEHAYFSKGSILFGLDKGKKEIRARESVFLVEGYTDCIAMVQHDYHNTVATLGTACTEHHLEHLSRNASSLYVLYDGDAAGQQAVIRLGQLCWRYNLELYVVRLPSGDDPASLLGRGVSLDPFIAQATDIFGFLIESFGSNFNGKVLQEKMRLVGRILDLINRVESPIKRDILLQKASQTLGIELASLKNELRHARNKNNAAGRHDQARGVGAEAVDTPQAPPAVLEKKYDLDRKVFCAIMEDISLVCDARISALVAHFPEPLQSLLVKLANAVGHDDSLDFACFFDMLDREEQLVLAQITVEHQEPVPAAALWDLVAWLYKRHWKTMVHGMAVRLERLRKMNDNEAAQKLIDEFLDFKRRTLEKASSAGVKF